MTTEDVMIPADYFMMMIGGALLALLLPVICALFWRRQRGLHVVPAFFGVMAYVLTVPVAQPLLLKIPFLSGLTRQAALYAFLIALAAGVTEELSRWISFRVLRQTFSAAGTGIAFGLGFGGCASVMLALQLVSQIQDCNYVNLGAPELPAAEVEAFLRGILGVDPVYFLLGSLDRLPYILIQTAFSLIVWYAVAHGRLVWIAIAVLLHTAADLPMAAMRVQGVDNLLLAEITVFGLAFVMLTLAWRLCRQDLQAGAPPLPALPPEPPSDPV
jgi:uncharacterized membrane protein YhfC